MLIEYRSITSCYREMAAAAFPPPPSFYKLYGNEGEQRVGTVRACLLPPEPPAPTEGEYQLFGQLYTVLLLDSYVVFNAVRLSISFQ